MSTNQQHSAHNGVGAADELRLSEDQVLMIEEALSSVGEFGEVRLVVEKGRLRFVVTQTSQDALKWQPRRTAGR